MKSRSFKPCAYAHRFTEAMLLAQTRVTPEPALSIIRFCVGRTGPDIEVSA
ncbi:hypothetical protein [Aeromonas molluscorum]|jgi:hypothetical protein|uniref:hypothetical protein n=1 Tax=Aeromonas molluscorum TaxID=271417 RepID=UPI0003A41C1D|nr:hypothetical protein [Aeromonas molluscorum]